MATILAIRSHKSIIDANEPFKYEVAVGEANPAVDHSRKQILAKHKLAN